MEQRATSPRPSPPKAEREKEALVRLWLIYWVTLWICIRGSGAPRLEFEEFGDWVLKCGKQGFGEDVAESQNLLERQSVFAAVIDFDVVVAGIQHPETRQ